MGFFPLFRFKCAVVVALSAALMAQNAPAPAGAPQYRLPNGWKITPAGKSVQLSDMVLKLLPSPDGAQVMALQGGYNAEGIAAIDVRSNALAQNVELPAAWLGMAWSPDGAKLYVSGGNGNGNNPYIAPIYVLSYLQGKLSTEATAKLETGAKPADVYWSGLVHHPNKPL